jgi:hypothetical protein
MFSPIVLKELPIMTESETTALRRFFDFARLFFRIPLAVDATAALLAVKPHGL